MIRIDFWVRIAFSVLVVSKYDTAMSNHNYETRDWSAGPSPEPTIGSSFPSRL